jgi:ADP-dependent NAD(P)H-hydrate dehydratase / NAD(P)H-hydrate epimerase
MRRSSVYGREVVHALTAEEAVEWDRTAREDHGVPERLLMENAGRAVAGVVQRLFPDGVVGALVGSGHNGADALVALRVLQEWGRDVCWIQASSKADTSVLHEREIRQLNQAAFGDAVVWIDGALGTGTRGAPREPIASSIRSLNASQQSVVAVDLPSGVDATTGRVEADAVKATVTVTFGAAKVGLLLQPARLHCGRLIVAEIGFPPLTATAIGQLITPEWAHARLPRRTPNAHKGTAGRVLLLAGSRGMAGAAAIAGRSALRAGAGLLRIASAAENREILQRTVPEATFYDAAGDLPVAGSHALIAGCGLGISDDARAALERALEQTRDIPVVLDADALNLLARDTGRIRQLTARRAVVLTPHVREFSRITGEAESAILADPISAARRLADQSGATVLLKGQPSIIATSNEPVLINTTGSSDLATGGMGDQLAGMIGAFLAAGADARTASALALFYGGRAADLANRGRSLLPRDVNTHLHRAFKSPGAQTTSLDLPQIIFDQPARW